MNEFRIEINKSSRGQDLRVRLLSWGSVVALIAIAVFLYQDDSSNNEALLVISTLGAIVAVGVLACREALQYATRQMVFVLEADGNMRKRSGYSDVKIRFSEIGEIREEPSWLIITSTGTQKKIAIPNRTKGYGEIRSELAKYHAISSRAGVSLGGTALLAVAALSWAALLLFRGVSVVILAGLMCLITLALASRRLWVFSHRSPIRPLLWASLGFAWLAALLLIYLRMIRP